MLSTIIAKRFDQNYRVIRKLNTVAALPFSLGWYNRHHIMVMDISGGIISFISMKKEKYYMLQVASEKKRMRRCCRSSPNGIVWWYQFVLIWLLPAMPLLPKIFLWRERILLGLLLLPDLGCIEMMLIFTLHPNLELRIMKIICGWWVRTECHILELSHPWKNLCIKRFKMSIRNKCFDT